MSTPVTRGASVRILVIEDDPGHAALVVGALSQHQVTWANCVAEAVDFPTPHQFDVVLTDLSLPDVSGMEAVRRIRLWAPETPLVILTSADDDATALAALEHGAQDYLLKEEVLASIDTAGRLLQRAIDCAVRREELRLEVQRLVADLQDSKALLESKNRRLRTLCDSAQRFVENVSHDFRTPLAVIKEYSSLIRDSLVGPVNGEQQRMLRIVEDRADDLNTMVDDLLDVSKLEAGLLNVWRRRTRVDQVVAHILPALECKAEVRGVTLETHIDSDLPEVFCDQDKVCRIITNLVVNGIKFCRERGTVRLSACASFNSREVVVSVADDGPGVPIAMQQRIFERFTQLETSVSQSRDGFGLGLSIAKELADLNLGTISLLAAAPPGATFSFTIPFHDNREILARFVSRTKNKPEAEQGCSIMVVEAPDDASQRDLDDLDVFVSHNMRRLDLALRVDDRRWVVLAVVPRSEVELLIERMHTALVDVNRNRPMGPLPALEIIDAGSLSLDDPLEAIVERCLNFAVLETSYA